MNDVIIDKELPCCLNFANSIAPAPYCTEEIEGIFLNDLKSIGPTEIPEIKEFDESVLDQLLEEVEAFSCVKEMMGMLVFRVCRKTVDQQEIFPFNVSVEEQWLWIKKHFEARVAAFALSQRADKIPLLQKYSVAIIAVALQEARLAFTSSE